MFYLICFYVSLTIFIVGLLYKVSRWFSSRIDTVSGEIPTSARILSALKGLLSTIFSVKIFTLLKVFLLDVLFQRKTLREDFLRWLMHICIYVGFILLVLMHALDKFLTQAIFDNYYSTVNPFMFLRDLFGVLVIIGVCIAIYRRFILKLPRLSTNAMDLYALIIVGIIILSGILLEGVKITSYTRYQEMVGEYSSTDDEGELMSLESFWVKEFSLSSPHGDNLLESTSLDVGKRIHESDCADCHSNPRWAFTGYATASLIKPVARSLDEANLPTILLYIHFLSIFAALAYLPFSKMFHIFSTPISLLCNSVMDQKSDPSNIMTRQIMEMDACTHCGICSLRCSVLGAFEITGNTDILPSEKMVHIKALFNGKRLNEVELRSLQEGVYICTNCDRCTVVCPSGINLRDLWFQVREHLIQKDYSVMAALSPLSFYRGLMRDKVSEKIYQVPLNKARDEITSRLDEIKKSDAALSVASFDREFMDELGLSGDAGTYTYCFSCSTCTSSCPVVHNYEKPMDVLGLLPHQIIHSAVLGLRELAVGSGMLWDCLTCYKCQESCPQGVRLTEVFYKLKNLAVKKDLIYSKTKDSSKTA